MCKFEIKIAIDVKRSVLPEMKIPALGISIANALELIFEADPIKISEKFKSVFFYLNLHASSYKVPYEL